MIDNLSKRRIHAGKMKKNFKIWIFKKFEEKIVLIKKEIKSRNIENKLKPLL